ncbi:MULTISPECIES: DUF6708 domain-containing protein [unclassified Achromobacter]|uniref:DUF6708 domain-containing protein n=1 Tax=unclassified Achromobacter TaxID=2626865 RepID=UPI000B514CB8|nr:MULTISPECIES: DUF6708 domain-containing protein [unclassified Achromobacter]OWT69131.1 hypothetical protein CEY05_28250 [Achromobacter sp. HZ34]OWT70536.1 hypothetical protein CEY04_27080 [Achromobacter sp. HZ28]
MDSTGILPKFRVNRPLTEWERDKHLKQKKRLDVKLIAQLSVIRMNSRWLESVDRNYGTRGFITMFSLVLVAFCLYATFSLLWLVVGGSVPNENSLWPVIFTSSAVFFLMALGFLWITHKEVFRYTHYPLLFDRAHRKVHVFRFDGSVLSVAWDDVYFTLGRGTSPANMMNWDVRGMVLDADRSTVRETFALAIVTGSEENALGHWEFIRRYMEEGPQSMIEAVRFCMPIWDKKETSAFARERTFANQSQEKGGAWLLLAPFSFLQSLGRMLAMATSKIPRWPPEVAAIMTTDPQDPNNRDASINPPDLQ